MGARRCGGVIGRGPTIDISTSSQQVWLTVNSNRSRENVLMNRYLKLRPRIRGRRIFFATMSLSAALVVAAPVPVLDGASPASIDPAKANNGSLAITPMIDAVILTPMEHLDSAVGNAELAVRVRNGNQLQASIGLQVDNHSFQLHRDPRVASRFAGLITFDFERFIDEQKRRRELIESLGETHRFVFSGRESIRREQLEFIDPEKIRRARVESLPLALPLSAILMPASVTDPARSLMVTGLPVVNDPTRTFDICGNVGNPNGAWTFKTLMTDMANQALSGVDPADFVEDWLRTWQVNHTINTFPVPPRFQIGPQVLDPWPRIGGKLDLDRSPFRLLAIVNRVDLRDNLVYGGGGAGEGRFVFGVVNRNVAGGCSMTQFTVILEYGVPIRGCSAVKNYAQQWADLSTIPLGTAAYNAALQAITDQFTKANAAPHKPNGSAINQIRSNEIALASPWELREFILPATSDPLKLVSTVQTPHHTRNNSLLLADFINVNAAAILAGNHVVPDLWAGQPFLTGSNFNFSVANSAVWNAPGVGNDERHLFSLETCNACHGGETRDNAIGPDLSFVHISPRLSGVQSQISKFLRGNGTLAAPSTFPKPDPIHGVPVRDFGDLLRRQNDLAGLIGTSCLSTGLIEAVRFEPVLMSH